MRRLNLKDESGQTMILALVCMTVLMGFVGLATDIGVMFHAKRNIQIAADSAAIAAAAELNYGDWNSAGQAASSQNGITNGVNGAVVAINNGPTSGPFAGNPNYVEAIVTQTEPTFFSQLFNVLSMNVSARAVATLGPAQGIYTLAPAGTGLTLNGMTVNIPTGTIDDNSASNPTGLAANSGTLTAQFIGVVGGYTNGGATITPTPVAGIAPGNDPLDYLTPPAFNPAACLTDPDPIVPTTLAPGCYNGLTIGGNIAVTLSPGMYIINGELNISGTPTITGTGITFYFPTPTAYLNDNGGETWDITAPTAAPYDGVLFYEDPSDTNALTFNNGNNSILEGIIYAPSANVSITADNTTTLYESIDAATVTLGGTGTLQDYALINNSTVLTAAQLVE